MCKFIFFRSLQFQITQPSFQAFVLFFQNEFTSKYLDAIFLFNSEHIFMTRFNIFQFAVNRIL